MNKNKAFLNIKRGVQSSQKRSIGHPNGVDLSLDSLNNHGCSDSSSTVLRYIFQNPVKAGIVTNVENYIWTNYLDYIEGNNRTDTDFALKIISVDRDIAIRSFVEFINTQNSDACLDGYLYEKRIHKGLKRNTWIIY